VQRERPPTREGSPGKSRLPTSPAAIRLANLFRRKLTTEWSSQEIRAFRSLQPFADADLAAVEAYYAAHWPPSRDQNVLRHDLKTLLNNWPGEVDRANTWATASPGKSAASSNPVPVFNKWAKNEPLPDTES
jgi:hypothetical protein